MKKKIVFMALPGLFLFVFFIILPFGMSARYSFLNDVYHKEFTGLSHFKSVLSNRYFRMAFGNSFLFSVIGITVLILLAILLALGVHKLGGNTYLLRVLLTVPVLLPTAGVVLAWQRVFREMFYYELMKNPLLGSFWYILPVYLMYLWKNVGICMLVLLAALDHIPAEVYEAARLDGASGGQCTRRITLPLMRPNLLLVLLYAFMSSLRIFKESYLFFGSTHYPEDIAYTLQYYMNNHFLKMNYPTLSVASLVFTFVIAVIVASFYRLESRFSDSIV